MNDDRSSRLRRASPRCAAVAACALLSFASCATRTTTGTHDLERMVLAALDGEALYTVAGGLKPVSSGYWKTRIDLAAPDGQSVDDARRALQSLDDETLSWGLHPFAATWEGHRSCHAWVAHRTALAALLERRADVFLPFGITPATRPAEVLAIVERLPRADRFRAYGLLFGYPDEAVEFYVAADARRAEYENGVAPRRFVSIPTFGAETGRFVWAVAPDSGTSQEESALRRAAAPILERYRLLRARLSPMPPTGALELLEALRDGRQRPPAPIAERIYDGAA